MTAVFFCGTNMDPLDKAFWDEFDRRLDRKLDQKLNQKLDEKLDQKLGPINAKINALIHWTQRQDRSLEKELTMACRAHLERCYQGYVTVTPHASVIGKLLESPATSATVTEFDGVLVLTNDPAYAEFVSGKTSADAIAKDGRAYMVIVEAKQHITKKKVERKIAQREAISSMLSRIPSMKHIDPFVGLYIGGLEIDPSAQPVLDKLVADHRGHEFIGLIELNGARFKVSDAKTDYGASDIVYGGRRRRGPHAP